MKELSLNILDIAKNSTDAGAGEICISIVTDEKGWLTLSVSDNGCGMDENALKSAADPFYTTRKTRSMGMGLPLLRLAAEQTGGSLTIMSSTKENDHGTTVVATFDTSHIDFPPLGDVVSSMCVLISGHPDIDFIFLDKTPTRCVSLDTRDVRKELGRISLSEYEVIVWIRKYLYSQYEKN